jgi:hypothetical protein
MPWKGLEAYGKASQSKAEIMTGSLAMRAKSGSKLVSSALMPWTKIASDLLGAAASGGESAMRAPGLCANPKDHTRTC